MAARVPSVPAIAVSRSCEITPISSRAEEILNEVFTLASSAITSERVNGRLGRTHRREIGGRTRRPCCRRSQVTVPSAPDAHVAGHQFDADHRAGLQLRGIAHAILGRAAGRDSLARFEPELAQLRRELLHGRRGEAAERERRRDFGHPRIAECRPAVAAGQQRARSARAGETRARRRASGVGAVSTLSISSIGRMPAIGSLAYGNAMRHRADQLAIDVNRAAAHALHDAGMFQRSAGKPRQDQFSFGPVFSSTPRIST